MKFFKSFLFSILISSFVQAQDNPSVEKNQFKIDFLNPGLTFEHGLTKKSTLFSEVGLGLSYQYSSNYGSTFVASPFIQTEYRYYYNFERRMRKERDVSHNSGNFFGLNAGYTFEPITNNEQNFISNTNLAGIYGYQRTNKSGFNYGLKFGVGYSISEANDDAFYPYFDFSIGWVLGKKNK